MTDLRRKMVSINQKKRKEKKVTETETECNWPEAVTEKKKKIIVLTNQLKLKQQVPCFGGAC